MYEKKKINISNILLFIAVIIIFIEFRYICELYCCNYFYKEDIAKLNEEIEDLKDKKYFLDEEFFIYDSDYHKVDEVDEEIKNEVESEAVVENVIDEEVEEILTVKDFSTGDRYTVNEIQKIDGISNEECGVTLFEDKTFQIYMGWGTWHIGYYEMDDEKLICYSNRLEWESGGTGYKETDVIFTFAIKEKNLLELTDIKFNVEDTEKLVFEDGIKVGYTYSMKD